MRIIPHRGEATLADYYTIHKQATFEYIVDKSRFIAHVQRVTSETSAKAVIEQIRKDHQRANHHCYAYMIGEQDGVQKAADDGEPSGTAGVPILNVIQQKTLKDTLIVVTRYFGGVKLGAGGLIRAYGQTASGGVEQAGIVKRKRMRLLTVIVAYHWLGKLENELRARQFVIHDVTYTDHVAMAIYVAEADIDKVQSWLQNFLQGQADLKLGDTAYLEEVII